jgi:hypothetical protein
MDNIMKTLNSLKYLILVTLISATNLASAREGGSSSGSRSSSNSNYSSHGTSQQSTHSNVFPSYSTGSHYSRASHSDAIGNRVTQDHVNRIDFANSRSDHLMKTNVHVNESVQFGRSHYVSNYRPVFEQRNVLFGHYSDHYNTLAFRYPHSIGLWHDHFFYGGFYYGFYPLVNIDLYFYNPMVYWFYMPNYNQQYYATWYNGSEYEAYPTLHYAFAYHGLYYPTENLKQLLFGVSAMTIDRQVQIRAAITVFTKGLAQESANVLNQHVRMSNGDIVITHYEILGSDESIDLEGFISINGTEYDFKGLLDLQNPQLTSVFIPKSLESEPSSQQVQTLNQMNNQIETLKTETSPTEIEVPATPAEVSADPKTH